MNISQEQVQIDPESDDSVATGSHEVEFCAIIPAYQVAETVHDVVEKAREYAPVVIVVDDGSTDDTAACARQAGAMVLRHDQNEGKGAALNTGLTAARAMKAEFVITLDADGQHEPAAIADFVEAYRRTGIPVLLGNRMGNPSGMPLVRWLTNRFMSWLLSRIMNQYVADTQCGYRLYRCEIIPFIGTESQRFSAESEVLLHLADRGVRMGSVRVKTIYDGSHSAINPLVDTYRFFMMLIKYNKKRRSTGVMQYEFRR